MPALKNPKWELFATAVAAGHTPAIAYERAGYKPKADSAARASAFNLQRVAEVAARIAELKPQFARVVQAVVQADEVNADVLTKAGRLKGYARRIQLMEDLLIARATDAEHAMVPGASTGLLASSYEMVGKEKIHVSKFDRPLLQELRELEKQVAIERGEWVEKSETRQIGLSDVPLSQLNAEAEKYRQAHPEEYAAVMAALDKRETVQ